MKLQHKKVIPKYIRLFIYQTLFFSWFFLFPAQGIWGYSAKAEEE
jgi:hypothetical protein